ncbi:MAG: AAA family ATPase [Desulfocapsaceae bacterium]|nr:AAA family ATPase [Desulfocapsaceae bacterium]
MHLKNVTLRNFRCFEKLALDLHPRLTVLVAENGGGKTAILDGIAIGLSPVLRYLSSANQRLSGPGIGDTDFRLMPVVGGKGKKRDTTSDFAQVVIETTNGLVWDNWRAASKGKHPETKVGQSSVSTYASDILDRLITTEAILLPVFAFYDAHRGFISGPRRLRKSKVNYDYPTSALFGSLDLLSDFEEMLEWFDQEEAAELRSNKGCPRENWDESSALNSVRWSINAILGGAYHNPQFNTQHRFVVESKTTPSMFLQVEQLSQGYQSMLALGMDFARRLALANSHLDSVEDIFAVPAIRQCLESTLPGSRGYLLKNKGSMSSSEGLSSTVFAPALMLVDEIDIHLHPSWQQRVLGDLMNAFPCTQFIVTTHSPQVVSTVPSESIRILQDGQVFSAPPGTEGAEASRILTRVLGVDVRPLENEATKELNEYLTLVDADQWASARAVELRQKLDARYQGEEPALLDADLLIENRKWELEQ